MDSGEELLDDDGKEEVDQLETEGEGQEVSEISALGVQWWREEENPTRAGKDKIKGDQGRKGAVTIDFKGFAKRC